MLLGCMVSARSFAMGMNRFFDHRIDAINPRTSQRMIPKGSLSPSAGLGWSLFAGFVFVGFSFGLSPLAGMFRPAVLIILAGYPFMKKLTWLTHWYLGACLGFAPMAVAIALNGYCSLQTILLGLAVTFWTAGFDILYALQDLEFDRSHKLKSVPAMFGPAKALVFSRVCFSAMIALLASAGMLAEMGVLYFAGVGVVAGILIYEHILVRDADATGHSKHINAAFFNLNAYVSVLFLLFTCADYWG